MVNIILFHPKIRHDECLKVVEELTVGVLAALLLPVHTIRDPDQLMTYPALPAGKSVAPLIPLHFCIYLFKYSVPCGGVCKNAATIFLAGC